MSNELMELRRKYTQNLIRMSKIETKYKNFTLEAPEHVVKEYKELKQICKDLEDKMEAKENDSDNDNGHASGVLL